MQVKKTIQVFTLMLSMFFMLAHNALPHFHQFCDESGSHHHAAHEHHHVHNGDHEHHQHSFFETLLEQHAQSEHAEQCVHITAKDAKTVTLSQHLLAITNSNKGFFVEIEIQLGAYNLYSKSIWSDVELGKHRYRGPPLLS